MRFLTTLFLFITITSYYACLDGGDGSDGDDGDGAGINQTDLTRIVWTGADSWHWPYKLYSAYWDATDRIDLAHPLEPLAGIEESAVSPNGVLVAFVVSDDQQGLYVTGVEGGSLIDISGQLPDIDFIQWAPDSSYIAFVVDGYSDGLSALYVASWDGALNFKIAESTYFRKISWSPDSTYLAYIADQDAEGVYELYTSSPSGIEHVKVNGPLPEGGNVMDFQWAPDSSLIAYRADQEFDSVFEIYTCLPDGSGKIKLNSQLPQGGSVLRVFKWSPDSSYIAYFADQEIDDIFELYISQPTGSSNVKISGPLYKYLKCIPQPYIIPLPGYCNEEFVQICEWAPDSSRIAYIATLNSVDSAELFTSLVDGSGTVKINDPLPEGQSVYSLKWAPDGSRIAYIAGYDLYTSLPDGADNVQANNMLEQNRRIFSVGWSSESSFIACDICSLILYQYISPFDYQSYGGSVKTDCDLLITLPDGIGNVIVNEENVGVKYYKWSPYSTRIAYRATESVTEASSLGASSIYTCLPDGNEKVLVYLSNNVANGIGNFEWAP